jgi:hypothetical protein
MRVRLQYAIIDLIPRTEDIACLPDLPEIHEATHVQISGAASQEVLVGVPAIVDLEDIQVVELLGGLGETGLQEAACLRTGSQHHHVL